MELGDAPAMYAYRSDAEMYRYQSPEPPASTDAVVESIRRWLEHHAEDRLPMWVIVLKETGNVAGLIGFVELSRANSAGWLTYELARELWGRGMTTEAVRAILSYGFDTMGLNRIAAGCWDGNLASRRVMEKAGMRYEGTTRQIKFAKGAYRDLRHYSMLASEWKAEPASPQVAVGQQKVPEATESPELHPDSARPADN
jgi:ribosomal-protein-alanine N-acetyltransferase